MVTTSCCCRFATYWKLKIRRVLITLSFIRSSVTRHSLGVLRAARIRSKEWHSSQTPLAMTSGAPSSDAGSSFANSSSVIRLSRGGIVRETLKTRRLCLLALGDIHRPRGRALRSASKALDRIFPRKQVRRAVLALRLADDYVAQPRTFASDFDRCPGHGLPRRVLNRPGDAGVLSF